MTRSPLHNLETRIASPRYLADTLTARVPDQTLRFVCKHYQADSDFDVSETRLPIIFSTLYPFPPPSLQIPIAQFAVSCVFLVLSFSLSDWMCSHVSTFVLQDRGRLVKRR